ncbi:pyridoxamine 5'-phosphate oxidase family protein [Mesorhizobium atlanticum]
MSRIASVEQLEALYGLPGEASAVKELDHVIPEYAAFIEASPFVVLATSGPEGLDCSPRGDLAGFVRLVDDRTLMMPDRRGNNRADLVEEHHSRSARRAAVSCSGLGHHAAGQRPRSYHNRCGALRVLHGRRQAGPPRSPSSLSTRSISNAPEPSCAPEPVESGQACRPEVAADARPDSRGHQPQEHRRRHLRQGWPERARKTMW